MSQNNWTLRTGAVTADASLDQRQTILGSPGAAFAQVGVVRFGWQTELEDSDCTGSEIRCRAGFPPAPQCRWGRGRFRWKCAGIFLHCERGGGAYRGDGHQISGGGPGASVAGQFDTGNQLHRSRLDRQVGAGDGAQPLGRDVLSGRGGAVGPISETKTSHVPDRPGQIGRFPLDSMLSLADDACFEPGV